jgi:hypothetical protein
LPHGLLPHLRGKGAVRFKRLRHLDQHWIMIRRADDRLRQRGHADRLAAYRSIEMSEFLGPQRDGRRRQLGVPEEERPARRRHAVVHAIRAARFEQLERSRGHLDVQLAALVVSLLGAGS